MSQLQPSSFTSTEPVTELHSTELPFTFWLEVNGQRSPIYSTSVNAEGTRLSGVVESVAGAAFSLGSRLEITSPDYDVKVDAFVDGKRFMNRHWHRRLALFKSATDSHEREYRWDKAYTAHDEARALKFSAINFVDAIADSPTPSLDEGFGTIKLEVSLGEAGKRTTRSFKRAKFSLPNEAVDERSIKKGLSERASLDDHTTKASPVARSPFTKQNGSPKLVFELRYANKTMLESLGHIKPDPITEPLTVSDSPIPHAASPAPEPTAPETQAAIDAARADVAAAQARLSQLTGIKNESVTVKEELKPQRISAVKSKYDDDDFEVVE